MIIHKMNLVSGFIIIITGALVRISEYQHHFSIPLYNTAVRSLNTAAYRGTKFSAVPNTSGIHSLQDPRCPALVDIRLVTNY